ncbi:MAG: isochorismatase family protein [Anaerolineales bacterium]
MAEIPDSSGLLDVEDSVLIVIDAQDAFLDKLPVDRAEGVLQRICWLVRLAVWKTVPLVVTAEEIAEQPVARQLVSVLPAGTHVHDKLSFGLAGQRDILEAVQVTGRQTAVLVGLETDVCVMQSALGLHALGYRVAVVVDATDSPSPGYDLGLERIRSEGLITTSAKGLFYEWLGTVGEVNRFHRELPDMRALAGFQL